MKHLKEIKINTINHKEQRYETVGDYINHLGQCEIFVSKMESDYEFLVALHEIIEWYLTQKRGIPEKLITDFDIAFERERELGLQSEESEPGFDKRAPYRKEHIFATKLEKLMAKELGVNWKKYDKTVMSL